MTASVKTNEMIFGGDFGSSRKIWWISGLLVKRSGGEGIASGALASLATARLKVCLLSGVEEPNDAIRIEACAGFELVRNWKGRSFCV